MRAGAFGVVRSLLLAGLIGLVAGCRTTAPLPRVDLKEPGWKVHSGQAVWTRQRGGEGVAGDLLVATNPDGRAFVQFSKGPFPVLVAQSTQHRWSVEITPQNKRYSGHGRPPKRLMLLYLPRALLGQPLPRHWTWQKLSQGGWKLENPASGESVEVYFR